MDKKLLTFLGSKIVFIYIYDKMNVFLKLHEIFLRMQKVFIYLALGSSILMQLYEPMSPAPQNRQGHSLGMPSVPPHSLVAFGLFLRLNGYADVLLKERKKAQCLLRLVLGVTDDGDGGKIC